MGQGISVAGCPQQRRFQTPAPGGIACVNRKFPTALVQALRSVYGVDHYSVDEPRLPPRSPANCDLGCLLEVSVPRKASSGQESRPFFVLSKHPALLGPSPVLGTD